MPPSKTKPTNQPVDLPTRKTKPPDDPTIMVGGQPKIDLNATKLQINEFLKRHKVIRPSEGGKRKSLTKLREELKAGGHVVGVEGKSSTVAKGNTLSKLQRAEKTKKEAEYKQLIASNPQGFNVKNTINILGFKNNPIPPKPSAAEIELAGYGGIPINYSPPASTVSSAPDISQGVPVDEMRIYLSGRIPNTAFKDLNKRSLRDLYNEVKAEENEPSSEEEELVSEEETSSEEELLSEEDEEIIYSDEEALFASFPPVVDPWGPQIDPHGPGEDAEPAYLKAVRARKAKEPAADPSGKVESEFGLLEVVDDDDEGEFEEIFYEGREFKIRDEDDLEAGTDVYEDGLISMELVKVGRWGTPEDNPDLFGEEEGEEQVLFFTQALLDYHQSNRD